VSSVFFSSAGSCSESVGQRFELDPEVLDLPERVLAIFLPQLLLLVLRVEQAVEPFDLALDSLHRVDRVLHRLDQPSFDRLR
jgi:hypothetical protein